MGQFVTEQQRAVCTAVGEQVLDLVSGWMPGSGHPENDADGPTSDLMMAVVQCALQAAVDRGCAVGPAVRGIGGALGVMAAANPDLADEISNALGTGVSDGEAALTEAMQARGQA